MDKKAWSDEWVNYALSLHYKNIPYRIIAEKMTARFDHLFSYEAVKSKMKRIKKEHRLNELDDHSTTKILADGSIETQKILMLSQDDQQNPRSLMEKHGFDPDKFDMVSSQTKRWNSYSKKDGKVPMFSSSIKVKPKDEVYGLSEAKKLIDKLLSESYQPKELKLFHDGSGEHTLEVNTLDLHLGKYAWQGDSNDTYNMDIAEERFFYILNDLLDQVKHVSIKKIIFIWSHDFFHYDTPNKTTTRGTPQDTNTQYQEMFDRGICMLIAAIDLLKEVAPVETIHVSGNHDRFTSYFASKVLYHHYLKDENVEVDADAKIRKYRLIGNTLVMFTHGEKGGKRLDKAMAYEVPDLWAKSKFREIHKGHFHSEKETVDTVTEEGGVISRHISSATGTDRYHFEEVWTGATKKSQHFLYHDEKGIRQIIFTNII